jgi:hypothetical protein
MTRFTPLLAWLALAACTDTAPAPDVPEAREVGEADAWTEAYDQFVAAEYPHAYILLAHTMPWMLEHMPEMTPERARSEWLRDWDADERRRWLRPRLRHGPSWAGKGNPTHGPDAETKALARAMDGAAAYVRGLAAGEQPPSHLLDDMRNLGLEWPGASPMPPQPGRVK